jgi:hypothetical protein
VARAGPALPAPRPHSRTRRPGVVARSLPAAAEGARALLRTLAHPDVRALAALAASPSLVAAGNSPVALLDDGWRLAMLRERSAWLAALDADPAALTAHLAQSNARQLGRYAESLWQFWFACMPGAHVHAAGLPVKDGNAVRGEFDFIVTLPGLPGIQHLETGYKFFLFDPASPGGADCIGPNPADRFDRKWRHMVDTQLPLSQTPLGRAALPSALADQPITPRACLQGYVFYPHGVASRPLPTLAAGHARGWWARFDACAKRPAWTTMARAWTSLTRLSWIAPARVPASAAPPLSGTACQDRLAVHFATSRQAQLLAGLVRDRHGNWHESVRVFIVHPDWARPPAS